MHSANCNLPLGEPFCLRLDAEQSLVRRLDQHRLHEMPRTSDDKTGILKNLFGLHRGEIREVDFRWE